MTAKQVQIRRDTATNLNAATPASGELGYDTTNKRLVVGDGTTAGGIKNASAKDIQNNTFTYSTVGGTANAITLTNSPAITAYAAGQSFKFKATNTNSGATTVDVDGRGAKNIYKVSGTSLVALTGNEIVSGGIYVIDYDGTQFLLGGGIGAGSIIGEQRFTSSGTYTPTPGMRYCIVEAVGAGGGGGGGSPGSGGGGGEYARSLKTDADIGASKTVTIGAGGTGGNSVGTTPTAGGDTSLGSLVIAKGGSAGVNRTSADVAGGAGGTAGTGDTKVAGRKGGVGSTANGQSGPGGDSRFGFGGAGVLGSTAGESGTGYGAGGSGANGSGQSGGTGSSGFILITEYR